MTSQTTDFIPWTGGECPVQTNVEMMIRFRSGVSTTVRAPRSLFWRHEQHDRDIVAYKIIASPAKDDGWIEWPGNEGGQCPLPEGTRFEARLRGGLLLTGCAPSLTWAARGGIGDIVSYRILSQPTPALQPPAWSKGWHNPAGIKSAGEGFRFLLSEESMDQPHEHWGTSSEQWFPAGQMNLAAKYCSNTYRVPISTPFPSPPQPEKAEWTLSSYLAKHWPDWGDRKPHREDFTEEMLSGGWRPLFEGETVEEGDSCQMTEQAYKCHWGPVSGLIGSIAGPDNRLRVGPMEGSFLFRTRRPPIPPPARIDALADRLIETLLPIIEPETNENTMNQQAQASAPPTPELPPVGSRWAIEETNAYGHPIVVEGRIIAVGPDTILIKGGSANRLYSPAQWSRKKPTRLLSKKELRRQAKAAAAPFTLVRKPGLIRRFAWGATKLASAITIGALFSTPIKYGMVAAGGYLWALVTK